MADHLTIVAETIIAQLGCTPWQVTAEAALDGALAIDTLDLAAVAVSLESQLGIEIEDHDLDACFTVGDIAALCARLAPARAAA